MARNTEKCRATLRVMLGNAQMFMAVVAIVLLWKLGVCPASIIAAAVAAALLLMSAVLFHVLGRR